MTPPVPVRVDSRIRLRVEALPVRALVDLRRAFTHANPEYKVQQRAGRRNHGEPETYQTFREEGGELSLPRGGMARLREVLTKHGVRWRAEDARRFSGRAAEIPPHRYEMRAYQREAIDALLRREQSLLRAPTGCGKTVIGFAVASALRAPTLVVVWSGSLMKQWVERVTPELGMDPDDVGVVGDGEYRLRPLTVAMQQTLVQLLRAGGERAREVLEYFDVLVADEVQRFAAPTLFDTVDPFPARYRIGISADERRADEKEFLVYDLFGPEPVDVDRRRLVREGWVLDVEVCVVPTQFDAPWYPRSKNPRRFHKLLEQMREDERRNALALSVVEREVEAGHQVLVFSHRVEHCREFDAALAERGIRSGVMVGGRGADEKAFEASKRGIRDGSLRVACGTVQAIGQGLDLPSVGRGVVLTPLAGNRAEQQFNQVRGRLCRPDGEKDARIYYLHDPRLLGKRAVLNLSKWCDRVRVLDRGEWVDADAYLGRTAARAV